MILIILTRHCESNNDSRNIKVNLKAVVSFVDFSDIYVADFQFKKLHYLLKVEKWQCQKSVVHCSSSLSPPGAAASLEAAAASAVDWKFASYKL